MLARDSESISQLFKNATYEGHPQLWNSLLFLITRFSSSVFYMQVLNISIMSACVYLFLKHAPFEKLISVLIVFGYFFIYEYHIISRNYAISLLFLTIVFIQLNKINKNHLVIAFCLLLLSLTHIYSIIIVLALSLLLIFLNKNSNVKYLYLILIISNVLFLFYLNVPADHVLFKYDTDSLLSFKRIGKAFSIYLKGFLPIPDLTTAKAWNSNWIVSFSKPIGVFLSILLAIVPFFIFRKNKPTLFFFYFSTLLICLFIYISPLLVATRHCGFIFVILIFSFWLKTILDPSGISEKPFYRKIAIAVLSIHILSGTYLSITDINQPFSNAKNVANFLRENNLENKEIFLSNLSSGPAISAYLNKKIIYPESEEKSSFCKWNTNPFILSQTQLVEKLNSSIKADTSILILNTFYLKEYLTNSFPDSSSNFKIIKLSSFDGAMLPVENYNVYYLLKR